MLDKLLPKAEQIRIMVDVLGWTEAYAEFVYAIETGEIDGDIELVPDVDGEQQPEKGASPPG